MPATRPNTAAAHNVLRQCPFPAKGNGALEHSLDFAPLRFGCAHRGSRHSSFTRRRARRARRPLPPPKQCKVPRMLGKPVTDSQLAELTSKLQAARDRVLAGSPAGSVAVSNPSNLLETLSAQGRTSDAVAINAVGEPGVSLDYRDTEWPPGIVVATDMSWVVEGTGPQRTLLVLN